MTTNARPADQLFNLCSDVGATPERIRQFAPFMKDLPATKDALKELQATGVTTWEDAALALLRCVVRPNGAIGYNEHNAFFARECLGLDDVLRSMSQRMDDLVNYEPTRFPTAPRTLASRRREAMAFLADGLRRLGTYPCGNKSKIEKVAKIGAEQLKVLLEHSIETPLDFADWDVEGLILEFLERAVALFDVEAPDLTTSQRTDILIGAVLRRAYEPKVERLGANAYEVFIEPSRLLRLFRGETEMTGPEWSNLSRSIRLLVELMEEIEMQDRWDEVLLDRATDEGSESTTATEADWQQRMQQYIEEWKNLE